VIELPGLWPPGLALLVGALLAGLVRGRARDIVVLAAPLVGLAMVWALPEGASARVDYLQYQLVPVQVTELGRLFGTVFCLTAFAGVLFALRTAPVDELAAALAYAGGAVGVTFAGDMLSLFIGWELMAVASTFVIWSHRTPAARSAGLRYLLIHLFGGMLLMVGIAGRAAESGTLAFTGMALDGIAEWLILAGFLVNAGAPPLSAWVADAYPEASPSGMVFLSAFTTKTAVFALMVAFPGAWVLIPVGLYMIVYGIVYALREDDMRRILAYSLVNQVGFMVAGVGIGSALALNGVAAHAFAHILYKALLLMAAGAVLYRTGLRRCSDLGGLARALPLTAGAALVGGATIAALPLTVGFTAKALIASAAAKAHLTAVWYLLAAGSAGVIVSGGLKFPWLVFFDRDRGLRPEPAPRYMGAAMGLLAALCVGLGVWYQPLYALLPHALGYEPYTASHVLEQLQLALGAALAFFLLLPWIRRQRGITLDWDWLYRGAGYEACRRLAGWTSVALARVEAGGGRTGVALTQALHRQHGPHGALARSWPVGSMVLWVTILLAAYLLVYYL